MIIVVGGIKGGSGKSTVATNLAVLCATEGQDILLIDSDDQETASDFTILRNESQPDKPAYTCIKLTGAAVRTETLRLSTKYETIIIDTGGRDTTSQRAALSVANVLLVPFVPRSFDVWTLEKVGNLVTEIKTINPDLTAYTFINRADPKGQDNDDAAEVLKETTALTFIDAKLGMRKAFSNAAATGQGVAELKPTDSKAIAEMATLFQCVFNVIPILNQS
jgi:chromosome partitioning protein